MDPPGLVNIFNFRSRIHFQPPVSDSQKVFYCTEIFAGQVFVLTKFLSNVANKIWPALFRFAVRCPYAQPVHLKHFTLQSADSFSHG